MDNKELKAVQKEVDEAMEGQNAMFDLLCIVAREMAKTVDRLDKLIEYEKAV